MGKDKKKSLKKTVKIKMDKGQVDPNLQETVLILMHHQEAMVELLVEKGVFTREEFEAQVDQEIDRSIKR